MKDILITGSTGFVGINLLNYLSNLDLPILIVDRKRQSYKENIFEAHRNHLYQYLANEMEWSHLIVAFIYSLFEFIIIVGLYLIDRDKWTLYSISILTILSITYTSSNAYILKRIQKLNT